MPGRQPEHPAGGTWWRRLLAAVGLAGPHCGAKPTPAEDMAVAYRAVSDGDLPHAAFHVACALYAGDPNDRKALALLDRLVGDTQKSGGDPLALAPLKRDNYAGTVAVRARILAHLGQYREAFNLLAQVQHADRARPLWRWAAEWATRPGAAAQAEPGMAGVLLASAVGRHGGVRVEDPAARAELEAILPLLGVMVRPPPAPDVAGRLQPRTAFDVLSSVTAGPPPQPEKWMAWNWIRAVQFAATLVLSKWDGGWVGSVRRKALLSLARGPVDWTTEAAITALGQVCREETLPAEAKEEIVAVLRELANALPDRGHCCYPYALAAAVMRLPFPTEQLRPKFSPLWRYVEGLDAEAE